MVMELTIIPRGPDYSISGAIAGLANIIEKSGLDYQMTAFGTLVEGPWDELMKLARECHFEARRNTERVLTMIRIDDYDDRTGEIAGAVSRVEQKLGRALKK
ncbi:MAG: MTH1187 family thiamine-binding protein [Acidobacteriaceae bacterium]